MGHGGLLGIGEKHFLVPVEAVSRIDSDHVHIDRIRENLASAPGYNPDLAYDRLLWGCLQLVGLRPVLGTGLYLPRVPVLP